MSDRSKFEPFSGEEILVEDMGYLQDSRIDAEHRLESDFWRDGVIRDPNGLSSLRVTVDGTTATLLNVGQGTAYVGGYRIAVDQNVAYRALNPFQTTNGICTAQSTGNRGIPLADYTSGQSNFVWAQYMDAINTAPTAISVVDASVHYPYRSSGYKIVVSTRNPPGNSEGITNGVYLATVFAQGSGNSLLAAPNGITDLSSPYVSLIPARSVGAQQLTTDQLIAGSTANVGGTPGQIVQGTVSRPDLRASAIGITQIDSQSVTMAKIAPYAVGLTQFAPDQIVYGSTANLGGSARQIVQGTVSMPDLRASSVGITQIADSSVTIAKLATGLGALRSVQVFTTSGTWTKPANIQKVFVQVFGGGGGGGNGASGPPDGTGGGGGAGGWAEKFMDVSAVATVTVTVGTGGAAASTGVTSSFSTVSASGGLGGASASTTQSGTGGSGGVGTGGDSNMTGGTGTSGTSEGVGGATGHAGVGGSNFRGAGTSGIGAQYGGGGGGGTGGGAGNAGGAGGVIVLEYA